MNRRLPVVALAGALMVATSLPAGAQGPDRTAWWNAASVAGTALPATTDTNNLHLAAGPNGTLALAALRYHLAPFSTATLVLHVVAQTQVGTPVVLLCPTSGDSWKPGGNQPAESAPLYTCAGRSAPALVGSDSTGTTLTFLLDATEQQSPGELSVVLAPPAGTTTPFSLDLLAPVGNSLVVQPAAISTVTSTGAVPPTDPVVPPASVTPPAPPPGRPTDLAGMLTGLAGAAPVGSVPVALAPMVAPLISPLPPAPPVVVRLAAAPIRIDATDRGRRMALLLMFVLVGVLGFLAGRPQELPLRLLGGRASRGTTAPHRATADDPSVHGIGRFARPRDLPARRLV